jgi:hypothetical protein
VSCTRPSPVFYNQIAGEVSFGKHIEKSQDLIVELPCGTCPHCQAKYSKQWSQRMYAESLTCGDSCMITLTYDDDNLPDNATLVPDHVTEFIRELRRTHKFSYYYAGEYGEKNSRPHYHMACFGQDFCTKYLRKSASGGLLFTDPLLDKLWNRVLVVVNELSPGFVGYIAGYVPKKKKGLHRGIASADYELAERVFKDSRERYERGTKTYEEHIEFMNKFEENFEFRHPEFNRQSTRPAIGKAFFDKYWTDMYPLDEFVDANGYKHKPCRYFDKLLEKEHPELYAQVKEKRLEAMQSQQREGWSGR